MSGINRELTLDIRHIADAKTIAARGTVVYLTPRKTIKLYSPVPATKRQNFGSLKIEYERVEGRLLVEQIA